MIIGFTGSRRGMTPAQAFEFGRVLAEFRATWLIHGDCIGSDADAHKIARELKVPIEIRPCNIQNARAFCQGAVREHPIVGPHERNRAIVNNCNLLVGCPWTDKWRDQHRGGTVYTIRYAESISRKTIVVLPSGTLIEL